jgi:metal-responsive CopG/Arc/MetJ family transcriptional regulator
MKTAISIPDDLFAQAENAAERLGISRSGLYCEALRAYLEKYQGLAVTERLNQVYESENSSLDEVSEELQNRTLDQDDW